jgi:hypothetical protein
MDLPSDVLPTPGYKLCYVMRRAINTLIYKVEILTGPTKQMIGAFKSPLTLTTERYSKILFLAVSSLCNMHVSRKVIGCH